MSNMNAPSIQPPKQVHAGMCINPNCLDRYHLVRLWLHDNRCLTCRQPLNSAGYHYADLHP